MLTTLYSSGWLPDLGQVQCPLLTLIVPQTLAFLSSNVSAETELHVWTAIQNQRCEYGARYGVVYVTHTVI